MFYNYFFGLHLQKIQRFLTAADVIFKNLYNANELYLFVTQIFFGRSARGVQLYSYLFSCFYSIAQTKLPNVRSPSCRIILMKSRWVKFLFSFFSFFFFDKSEFKFIVFLYSTLHIHICRFSFRRFLEGSIKNESNAVYRIISTQGEVFFMGGGI